MRQLAFWIVVVAVVVGLSNRRSCSPYRDGVEHLDRASSEGRVVTTEYKVTVDGRPVRSVVLVSHDETPTPPKAHVKPGPGRAKGSKPAAAVAAPEIKRQPEWFPKDRDEEAARAKTLDAQGTRVLIGSLSASEEKAMRDLRQKLAREVASWIAGDVAPGWQPPSSAVEQMIQATYAKPVVQDLGEVSKDLDEMVTLYRAGARVDFSRDQRARLIKVHDHQVVRQRMLKGAGVLAFVLVALASIAGYIRTDEATKGNYTNRLRMLAAAGVGGAGVLIYQMLG